jgi:hypothetical protein
MVNKMSKVGVVSCILGVYMRVRSLPLANLAHVLVVDYNAFAMPFSEARAPCEPGANTLMYVSKRQGGWGLAVAESYLLCSAPVCLAVSLHQMAYILGAGP